MLVAMSVTLLVLAAGCAKQEPPKPATPAAPAASAPEAPVQSGKVLFENKCSVCHGVDRATSRSESKEKWASIVKEMQGKKDGWISDAEASKIVDYLAAEHGKK
jgi:mono/diheme cytochrome c family protein